jgi:hypothetical protein
VKHKTVGFSGVLLAVISFLVAVQTQAATYTWNKGDAGGTFNWDNSGGQSNWIGSGLNFPNATDDVALLHINHYNAETLNLNQAIILGSLSMLKGDKTWTIQPVGGSLTFASTGGSALLSEARSDYQGGVDEIYANITLSSPLVINAYGINSRSWGLYNGGYQEGLFLYGVISGGNGITKDGTDGLWLKNTANTFTGDINVRRGYLLTENRGGTLGNAANAITLGAPGTIGHLAAAGDSSSNLTRPLHLAGAGGALHAWYNFNVGTAIDGTGMLLLGKGTGQISMTNAADNTFVGETRVHAANVNVGGTNRLFPGDVTVQYFGRLKLNAASNVGGTVRVASVDMPTPNMRVPAILDIKNNFFPTLNTNSSGIISLQVNGGANIEAALAVGAPQLGNGYMFYGGGAWFYGASLQPNLDHVFRFFNPPGGGFYLDRSASAAGVLTDVGAVPHAVEVNSWQMQNGNSEVYTADANDFSGALTINPGAQFRGVPQTSGSPFGANGSGTVNLNAGTLYVATAPANAAPMSKGALNLQGQCVIGFNVASASQTGLLTFATMTRSNCAVLNVQGDDKTVYNGDRLGSVERLIISNGVPTPTNGMVTPWLIGGQWAATGVTNTFLTYDPSSGFSQAVFTATSLAAAGVNDIVSLASGDTVAGGGKTVYAVRTAGALLGAAGDKLTITSGGLILDSSAANNTYPSAMNHTADIDFGNAEGVIWISGQQPGGIWRVNQLGGKIYGSNGLTIGGPMYANHTPNLWITNDNTATLTGTITINEGMVRVSSTGLGNTNNMIVLNTCGFLGSGDNRGASLGGLDGTTSIYNPITLGPNGGSIENGRGALVLYGKITGPGGLAVWDFHDQSVQLYNPSNDWTGGTWAMGCNLYVRSGSKLGPGDVIVGGQGGTMWLQDTNAISPTARVTILHSYDRFADSERININCASATWGSLEGNGHVWVYYGGLCLLTIGGNNASTEFFGTLKDASQFSAGWNGSLVKKGTGTFTLWGEDLLASTTTVQRGTMLVNGLVTGKTVVDGTAGAAVLGGSGLVASNVTVKSGGTLAPGYLGKGVLTLAGGVTFDSSSAYQVTLGGTNAAVNFGQLSASGTIALSNATLSLNLTYAPQSGQQFRIMNNPAGTTVTGTFAGGQIVSATYLGHTYYFRVNYAAGDGNDVELTALPQGTIIIVR